ncbi:MAG: DUF2180 family protein [Ktedonobacteraceae bacterium]
MHCYLCWLETGWPSRAALGICRDCGVGICEHHLVKVMLKPVMGMVGTTVPRRYLLCLRCYDEKVSPSSLPAFHPPSSGRSGLFSSIRWRWLGRSRPGRLPEPEEAVAIAERLLKRQQSW